MRSRAPTVVGRVARVLCWGVLLVAVAVWRPAPAVADPTSDDCLMCHKDRSLAYSVGRSIDLYVDGAALGASVHGHMACVACHKGATLRHPAHLPAVDCTVCHRKAVTAIQTGAHRNVASFALGSCKSCHGTHAISKARGTGSAMCARCHQAQVEQYKSSWPRATPMPRRAWTATARRTTCAGTSTRCRA